MEFTFTPAERAAAALIWGEATSIPENDFTRDYRPVEGPTQQEGSHYWTHEEVKDLPLEHVWTVVDDGGQTEGLYALAGFHVVNKIYYMVTEVPWTTGTECAIWLDPEGYE